MGESKRRLAELHAHNEKRNALFRNPNDEDVLAWWAMEMGNVPPVDPLVPMAALHKARLQWLDATDTMLEQSKLWLVEHGFTAEWHGAPPLTPEQRDADRKLLGKPPVLDVN